MSEIVKSEYNALGEDNNYKTHYFKTSADQVVGLGRLKSFSYSVGDIVYSDTNNKVALKCTIAGTTSNAELDISTNAVGDSVTDGSVAWVVIERNISDGGVVSGEIIGTTTNPTFVHRHPVSDRTIRFGIGATGENSGIYDDVSGWRFLLTDDGVVKISAKDNSETKELVLSPNGTFTFDGKDVLTASGLIDNADLNSFTKAGTYFVQKGSATEAQGWTSGIWGTNGFLEVFVGSYPTGSYHFIKQIFRRAGTSDSNDWQTTTRQSMDGGVTWGEWRRIDNGGDQRTVANTGYYKTADGLVFAWTRIGQTSANPAVVNKPIPFQTFIAQPVDVTTIDDDARAHQWISGETTNTTDTFKRNNNNDASTIFWVGKAV